MADEISLSEVEIKEKVLAKIEEYEQLSPLEQYAIFMGKAQILEFGLKGLLNRKFGIPLDSIEKWTLGQVKNELRDRGLRPDFILFLEGLLGHRNNMAHEFFTNNAITNFIGNFSNRKLYGELLRAIYEIEQIIVLYDWCEEHDGWLQ